MDKDNLMQFVRKILPMSRDKAEQLVEKFQPMKIGKHEYLLKAGKVCSETHFIESGTLRAYTYDLDGNEVTTAFYVKHTFAADLLSFFKRDPAKEYIQAITDCETWYLTYEDMQANFHTIPEFREYGRLNIVEQYSQLKERMLSMLQETAEQRYSRLISSSPEIFQEVPLKYIASYLGIADTSLSRIRKEFAKK
ncbi:CRP-like cAMP-binding protein [Chitinophaga polysaccharea]|uniref:CRP-like cAMP-binding protein n=1 Tax=Chitinophaga polysaccharea TaxID=1293035 RepID=A0A561PQR8_9BACT|nr:Crp/Fnr family transcriptional regulator [Chitinophaga polysaccharea]TWF40443.1 CRP-like cAMP-binding protein [Chitinophaga polysaccharea]